MLLEIEKEIVLAKKMIEEAEAIIITAGAGMGVDSGLPDFRGSSGFWKAYPPLSKLGYGFTQMANATLFSLNPKLAWGFYGHRLQLYREIVPHKGFEILLDLVKKKNENYFIYTSNVDGQFEKAGFDREKIYEVHGSIHYLQCSEACKEEVWKNNFSDIKVDMERIEAEVLPKCNYCDEIARPNILMFDDWNFIDTRIAMQSKKFEAWKKINKNKRKVILEIGAGSTIPTLRIYGNMASRTLNTTLIRINPREPEVSNKSSIGLALGGMDGIEKVCKDFI